MHEYAIGHLMLGAAILGMRTMYDKHGPDQKTHNERLHKVLKRLEECHLTLNEEKYQFSMNKLVFMWILLTDK